METERLVLRRYTGEDKVHLISLFTDEDVMNHVGDGVLTEAQAEEWWEKLFKKFYPQNLNIWAVFAKQDLRYIGHAGIYPRPTRKADWEFVYFLSRDAWGKGYATEIARRIIEYGFNELKLTEIFATIDDDHSASIKVAEKAGLNFSHYEYDEQGRFSVYSTKSQNSER
jgi:RimJ/RimL family protein N-acetyltransferase